MDVLSEASKHDVWNAEDGNHKRHQEFRHGLGKAIFIRVARGLGDCIIVKYPVLGNYLTKLIARGLTCDLPWRYVIVRDLCNQTGLKGELSTMLNFLADDFPEFDDLLFRWLVVLLLDLFSIVSVSLIFVDRTEVGGEAWF